VKKLAIVSILCLSAASAFSQCKTERVSAREEMHKASAVVLGTVTAAQPVPEAWDFLDGVNYTVHVDAKIHGKGRFSAKTALASSPCMSVSSMCFIFSRSMGATKLTIAAIRTRRRKTPPRPDN